MDGKPFSTAYYPSPGEQEASDLQNIKLIVISVSNKNMRKRVNIFLRTLFKETKFTVHFGHVRLTTCVCTNK